MANSRDEQLRSNRRLARQTLGLLVIVLVLIGVVTVIGWGVAGVRGALDDSEKKQSYADRVYGLVMFDPLPFSSVDSVDQTVFKQAAIWGTVYQIQKNGGSLDDYERDEATGSVILPQLEVDAYISNLLGPEYKLQEGAFETSDMNYMYSDEKQGYLIPITGSVGLYTPKVEKIAVKNGKTYVTVGYVPTLNNRSDLAFTTPTEPVKYMDYVFTRGENRQWYLTALQESEMQPASSAASSQAESNTLNNPQALVESNLAASATDAQSNAAQSGEGDQSASQADSQPTEPAAGSEENSSSSSG